MGMGLIDCLLITLVNTVVCICLPKVVAAIGSQLARRRERLATDF